MAERRREKFYETMPGTMAQPGVLGRREPGASGDASDLDVTTRNWAPWLLVPLALILAWLLLSSVNNRNANTNTGTDTGTNGQSRSGATDASGGNLGAPNLTQ
ncbi:MAG TPA: hypothetical protein VI322_05145 [Candidatus Saccharimonadia bacterium]